MSVAIGSREARVHTQPSNRANAALAKGKSKASDERRVAYKPVLENPHQVKWPSTPLNVQNSVLACLADLLPEVAGYHLARELASRRSKSGALAAKRQAKARTTQETLKATTSSEASRKRARDDDDASHPKRTKLAHDPVPKPSSGVVSSSEGNKLETEVSGEANSPSKDAEKTTHTSETDETTLEQPPLVESTSQTLPIKPVIAIPPLLKHCTFGINEVTKRLEALANPAIPKEDRSNHRPRLRAVLVCRADVDPPLLIAHFPILVAACNSSHPANSSDDVFVKLVILPMGAEHSLAEITGLRRVAVMALDVETPGLERLESLLSSVPALRETWLAPPSSTMLELKKLVPTHVKQLKTSAPKDMKAAKEKRKRELEEAREKAKEGEGRQRKRRKLKSKDIVSDGNEPEA